ncbi:MAG: glycosyltransferase [Actinomycetota bacterium]|nr:glycosyltransferase [Actinomycetota bacterium]
MSGGEADDRRDAGISLIATLLDEKATLGEWWRSIMAQTRPPREIVVVDGGSRDGTPGILREMAEEAPFPVRIHEEPGCNIARGRNRAIELASHRVIAVTDGGCVLHKRWLENLVRPMLDDPEINLVAGFYQPLEGDWFQGLSACATLPLPWEVRAGRFMPSSRSIAFRREVWEEVGGYPEWLDIGEDMYFNHAWKVSGISFATAKGALAYWRMRKDLAGLLKQYFLYARGDGESGMYPQRHAIRFSAYGWLVLAAFSWRGFLEPTLVAASLYSGRRWLRVPFYMRNETPLRQAAAYAALPPLLAAIDGAKMAGYICGLLGGRRR